MPARRYVAPVEFLADGGVWPDGPLVEDAPAYARTSAAFVRRLRDVVADRSLREVARVAGIGHATLSRLLAGLVVPDIATVAALEDALDADLWPHRHER